MEYGDGGVRVLTEIDEVEKQRQLFRCTYEGEERTVLINKEGCRQRWDFSIEHPIYGKLVCSYYPKGAEEQLDGWFGSGFAQEENGKSSVPGIPMWSCTEAGMKYLQKHIQQGLHDALCGLVMEAQIQGLLERNGHEFMISGLDMKKQIKDLRRFYQMRTNKRLPHQGPRRDRVGFVRRAYKAYCDTAEELEKKGRAVQVTKERVAEKYVPERRTGKEVGIDVRSLDEQIDRYGFTCERLFEVFAHWRRYAKEESTPPVG
jgi:hypothetical protein